MTRGRRSFLQLSAALAASAPLAGLRGAQAGGEGCGAAMGTYGLQSMELGEALRFIADTGFDAAEITTFPGTTGELEALDAPAKRAALREILQDTGLRLCALMADVHPSPDDGEHRAALETLAAHFDLARDLAPDAPPLVQTVLGGRDWEESRQLFVDRLADWMQVAADLEGVVSVKPHRSHAMSTPEQGRWLIEQLGSSPRVRMVYDYSHYALREPELTVAATVETALPVTNYVAVKDAVPAGEGRVRFALPGEGGGWDHADIIRAFHEGGYRGDFCCEVSAQIWRNEETYDPVEATLACYRNLAAAFERAGVPRR